MQNRYFIQALQELAPGAGFRSEDGTYDNLEWLSSEIPQPTREQFDAKVVEIEANWAMNEMRKVRDARLSETDWVTARAFETGEPVSAEWATYRQALRDLTSTAEPQIGELGEVTNVNWPEKPE